MNFLHYPTRQFRNTSER